MIFRAGILCAYQVIFLQHPLFLPAFSLRKEECVRKESNKCTRKICSEFKEGSRLVFWSPGLAEVGEDIVCHSQDAMACVSRVHEEAKKVKRTTFCSSRALCANFRISCHINWWKSSSSKYFPTSFLNKIALTSSQI